MPSSRDDVGHHAPEPAGLKVVLDHGPLVFGNRAMVGAGQYGIGAGCAAGLGHHVSRSGSGGGSPESSADSPPPTAISCRSA